jgi:hypothetical protein
MIYFLFADNLLGIAAHFTGLGVIRQYALTFCSQWMALTVRSTVPLWRKTGSTP